MCSPGSANLFKLLQRLLKPEDELKRDNLAVALWPARGPGHMIRYFLQRSGADDLGVAQGRHDLIFQDPADL